MQLSKNIAIKRSDSQGIPESLFALPEKILQFGTGVLLRGLPDHFVDKANKQQRFNGRIVVVKSTDTGGTDAFKQQDGLYTVLERGVENGERTERATINAAISRVLSANTEWQEVLACAANPEMQIIISNTTEIGIVFNEADVASQQPISFPARVLDFLWTRYQAFNGNESSGMVIVPTELIIDNGTKLRNIVITLATKKQLPQDFINWLEKHNDFCNSLVDCIVPGKLPAEEHAIAEKELGYNDELMIMSEPYRLWAIETQSERTRAILSFSVVDEGIILSPDIEKFRELKLRLLNGTHTFSCGLAHLCGFTTVKEAMRNEDFCAFIVSLMNNEIVPLVVSDEITEAEARQFSAQVIDRFKNPFIDHRWLNITVQYTSKMIMRTIPLLERYYEYFQQPPELMSLGLAAFILFMHTESGTDGRFYGTANSEGYVVQDDKAAVLQQKWKTGSQQVVAAILGDPTVLGKNLAALPGLTGAVNRFLTDLQTTSAMNTLHSVAAKKTVA